MSMSPSLRDDRSMMVSFTSSTSNSDVESIEMEDELNLPAAAPSFLNTKKMQPTYKTRLFDDTDDTTEEGCSEILSLTPTAPRNNSHGSSNLNPSNPLKPLNLNNCLEKQAPLRRKRSPGDNVYRNTPRCKSDDSSDTNMYISPSPSSSYITMDGRCVTSRNPFSPMLMDNPTPPKSAKTPNYEKKQEAHCGTVVAPFLPDSLDVHICDKKERQRRYHHTSNHAPPPTLRHRPQKRFNHHQNEKNYLTKDGFPEKSGRYSFTGSPIQENTNSELMDTSGSPGAYAFKVRRLNTQDDVVAAAAATSSGKHGLLVDTSVPSIHGMDEVSPTDVLSFPTPPTPTKGHKSRRDPSTSTPAPPETPFLERRRRNQPTTLLPSTAFLNRHRPEPDQDCLNAPEIKSRFYTDFDIIGELGKGSFGTVHKVLSRLDGCMYAVKTALRQAKGNADRDRMLKEVYALAALSDQADPATFHIVRYHQAWMEDNRLYIQTELCTSTLQDEVMSSTQPLTHQRRYKLLREILLALEFIHRNEMVHLDIKPENVFLKNDQYKLGDFGLVTKISYHQDVEEGDSRYMSMELLSGDHQDLTKSDIFSLGATLYEICLGWSLPTNGQEWRDIRECKLKQLPNTPYEMEAIIRKMMHPKPSLRPAASDLLKHPELLSNEQKALIVERSKVFEANLALAAQAQRLQKVPAIPRTTLKRTALTRANTWTGPTGSFS